MKSALVLVRYSAGLFFLRENGTRWRNRASKRTKAPGSFPGKGLADNPRHSTSQQDGCQLLSAAYLRHRVHESVLPSPAKSFIRKSIFRTVSGHNARGPSFFPWISELAICGMMSHMCIDATVRAAVDKGYICTLPMTLRNEKPDFSRR